MKKILIILIFIILGCQDPQKTDIVPLTTVETPKVTVKPIPKDRCADYIPDIRKYALQYISLDFPYWYNVGVALTESSCRGNLTSFDGGIGLFQLTPSTGITAEISKHIPVDPYNTESNIRAQAYYIYRVINIHFNQKSIKFKGHTISPKSFIDNCGLNLADVFRFYNSGYWFFYEATKDSLSLCSNNEIAPYCVRSGTCVGKQYLSFCQISYSYPTKVYKYSAPYKIGTDGNWNFWYIPTDDILTVEFSKKSCP